MPKNFDSQYKHLFFGIVFYSMLDGKPHRLSTNSISLVLTTASDTARKDCKDIPDNVHCI